MGWGVLSDGLEPGAAAIGNRSIVVSSKRARLPSFAAGERTVRGGECEYARPRQTHHGQTRLSQRSKLLAGVQAITWRFVPVELRCTDVWYVQHGVKGGLHAVEIPGDGLAGGWIGEVIDEVLFRPS